MSLSNSDAAVSSAPRHDERLAASRGGAVEIVRVESRQQLREFIDLPWRIYRDEPLWVPPLKSQVRHLLDAARHPFWQHAERELFLARRQGRTVGRVAAIVDHSYNRFHDERMGIFGYFECEPDQAAADALFEAAGDWTHRRGMTFLRGPMNGSTNYELGLLIRGYEHAPTIMMPWQPPYYLDLMESCGLAKEKDLIAMLIDREHETPPRVAKLVDRIQRNHNVSIRTATRRTLDRDMALVKEIYYESWSKNWGFVPLSDEEFDESARQMARIMDPDLVLFMYHHDEPAGICVILPDMNPLLRRLNGHIGLTGVFKYLYYRHEVRGVRAILFGFKPQYRKLGLPLVAFAHLNKVLREKQQYHYLELGWNLEDNDDINRFDKEVGGREHKRYRLFRKELQDNETS
ncbi:MAG: hypothetical protein AB7U73_13985 [Pirellulales bacterium]